MKNFIVAIVARIFRVKAKEAMPKPAANTAMDNANDPATVRQR